MRALARIVAAVGLLAALALVDAEPSPAQVTGGCSATIAGQSLDGARSVRTAIEVPSDATITVTGTAPGPITGYSVHLVFGPARVQAASGTVDDGSTTWSGSLNVADYATYGVGLYRIEGETTGTPCTAWGYVKVTGGNPLTTVAGATGAALTVAGLAGMALSFPRRPKGAAT